jgi:hypothetical protein
VFGEALVGSFVFGVPMVVEEGTLEGGAYIAGRPASVALTALLGILAISGGAAVLPMTVWGRIDWMTPAVAASQTLVTAVVMAVGASLGDILSGE